MPAKIDLDKRTVTIDVPAVVPPRDMRAALHRVLDEALDAFIPYRTPGDDAPEHGGEGGK